MGQSSNLTAGMDFLQSRWKVCPNLANSVKLWKKTRAAVAQTCSTEPARACWVHSPVSSLLTPGHTPGLGLKEKGCPYKIPTFGVKSVGTSLFYDL